MQLAACPQCDMPRADADIAALPCPLCGYVAGEQVRAVPVHYEPPKVEVPPPVAVAVSPKPRWPQLVGVAALALVIGFGVAWVALPPEKVEVKTVQTVPVLEVAQFFPATKPTKPAEPPSEPKIELAPMPREVVVPVFVPPPAVLQEGGFAVIRLDRPNETFTLDRLGEGNKVKLIGKVQKLVVSGADGGAELDATGLETKAVSINGKVEGNAKIRVKAPGGTVSISKPFTGGSTVEIDASGSSVMFHVASATISGGAKVKILAKSVHFTGRIEGGSTVDLTLNKAGGFRFADLADGSKIHYRGEEPDAMLNVHPGNIDNTSECKRQD